MLIQRNNILKPLSEAPFVVYERENKIELSQNFRVAFLEAGQRELYFQDLPSSRQFSEHSSMRIKVLRSFDGLVLVIYEVGCYTCCMLYRIEEVHEEEEIDDLVGLELGMGAVQSGRRVRLDQISEVDGLGIMGEDLCDAFFVERKLFGIVTKREIILCALVEVDEGLGEARGIVKTYRVEVDGFSPKHNYRKVYLDRSKRRLFCVSGTENRDALPRRRILSSCLIDLEPIYKNRGYLDSPDSGLKFSDKRDSEEKVITNPETSKINMSSRSSELTENLTLYEFSDAN